jgi:hypothetical protein
MLAYSSGLYESGFLPEDNARNKYYGYVCKPTQSWHEAKLPGQPFEPFNMESLSEDKPLMLRGSPIYFHYSQRSREMRHGVDFYAYVVGFEVRKVLYLENPHSFERLFGTYDGELQAMFPKFWLTDEGHCVRNRGIEAVVFTGYYEDIVESQMKFPRLLLLNPKKSVFDIRI